MCINLTLKQCIPTHCLKLTVYCTMACQYISKKLDEFMMSKIIKDSQRKLMLLLDLYALFSWDTMISLSIVIHPVSHLYTHLSLPEIRKVGNVGIFILLWRREQQNDFNKRIYLQWRLNLGHFVIHFLLNMSCSSLHKQYKNANTAYSVYYEKTRIFSDFAFLLPLLPLFIPQARHDWGHCSCFSATTT